jgi:hypothetical protein
MLPQCSLARLLCQMKLTGGWVGQQILFHLLLKLGHLRSHTVDKKFVLSDSNHVKNRDLPGFFGYWNNTPLIIGGPSRDFSPVDSSHCIPAKRPALVGLFPLMATETLKGALPPLAPDP